MAEYFNVTEVTINNWKKKYPNFFKSLKRGKDIADNKVIASLFERATGYSHPDVHISNFQGDITITPIIKHYPPEVTACIYWLINRQPDNWKKNGKDYSENSNTPNVIDFKFSVINENKS